MPRRGKSAVSSWSDRECLELFVERADELWRSRLLQKGFVPSLNFKWDRVQGLRFEFSNIDNEDLRSFLVTFRQFISNDEPVFLYRIYHLCREHFTSDEFKRELIESRQSWKQAIERGGIRLNYNGRDFSPEEITRLWINGFYFHSDYEATRMIKRLLPHEYMFARHAFLDHLADATGIIFEVGRLIHIALREGLVKV